jgi:hypothetical protein
MTNARHLIIPAPRVESLVWKRDALIDVIAGGARYDLDGTMTRGNVRWPYPFDGVATAPNSDYAVIYTRLGTKALLLKNNTLVRQLDRSFYYADRHEYPVCIVKREDRTLLIHCPDHAGRLEFEDAETGERLTSRSSEPSHFYCSRLEANAGGTRLLAAGWVWTPVDGVVYYDVEQALREPQHLDSSEWTAPGSFNLSFTEPAGACWLTDDRVVISGSAEAEEPDLEDMASPRLLPNGLMVYDTTTNAIVSSVVIADGQQAGSMVAVDDDHVLALYKCPRLIRLSDGTIQQEWPEISSGMQASSIVERERLAPPMAFDRTTRRFAIAQADGIHVIELHSA